MAFKATIKSKVAKKKATKDEQSKSAKKRTTKKAKVDNDGTSEAS